MIMLLSGKNKLQWRPILEMLGLFSSWGAVELIIIKNSGPLAISVKFG